MKVDTVDSQRRYGQKCRMALMHNEAVDSEAVDSEAVDSEAVDNAAVDQEAGDRPKEGPSADGRLVEDDDLVEAEVLVEEVSIDGMCGVY